MKGGSPKLTPPPKTPRTPQSGATPQSNASSPSSRLSSQARPPKPSPTQVSSAEKKDAKEGELAEEDQKWFTGCVPLGLEDDKYWLSELQVYLRANFAEAFGATEEDIAAPMHGRNKPIALGQVGIRCMHCKRKYSCIVRVFVETLNKYANKFPTFHEQMKILPKGVNRLRVTLVLSVVFTIPFSKC